MQLELIGPHPFARDEQGRQITRIGTLFPQYNTLWTQPPCVHALQRLGFIDRLNAERARNALPPFSLEEEDKLSAESVDLIFEADYILIRPDPESPGGGTWGTDDTIVAALDQTRGLFRVPAAGGMPQPLTDAREDPSGILIHRRPQALPGGKGVLFAATSASRQGSRRVLAPNGGKLRTVVENSTDGRFLASGYVVYYQRETLFAAPMDADRLELTGPAVPLVYEVSNSGGRADFDLSTSGTLVYRHGTAGTSLPSWLYSSGKIEPVLAKSGNFSSPRLSPDGTRLALSVIQDGKQNIWVYDLGRESRYRLTSGDEPELLPTWTPDC